MGTFGGHALPGAFFILVALWHSYQLFTRYFSSKLPGNKKFHTAVYFPLPCCRRVPLEPIITIVLITIANSAELITAVKDGHFGNIGNGQHMIMFSFFGLLSFMSILDNYKVNLPPNMLYLCGALAFSIEALLFYWHLHIQEPMEMQVHMLLLYVLVTTVICLFVEMLHPDSIAPAFCRVYLILLQGVWFWQIGFILYAPFGMKKWDYKDHYQMMVVTIIFSIHCALSLFVILFIWFSTSCRFGQFRKNNKNNSFHYTTLPLMSVDVEGCDEKIITMGNGNSCNGHLAGENHDEDGLLSSEFN